MYNLNDLILRAWGGKFCHIVQGIRVLWLYMVASDNIFLFSTHFTSEYFLAELQNSALNLMCGGLAGVNNWFPDCKSDTF